MWRPFFLTKDPDLCICVFWWPCHEKMRGNGNTEKTAFMYRLFYAIAVEKVTHERVHLCVAGKVLPTDDFPKGGTLCFWVCFSFPWLCHGKREDYSDTKKNTYFVISWAIALKKANTLIYVVRSEPQRFWNGKPQIPCIVGVEVPFPWL